MKKIPLDMSKFKGRKTVKFGGPEMQDLKAQIARREYYLNFVDTIREYYSPHEYKIIP